MKGVEIGSMSPTPCHSCEEGLQDPPPASRGTEGGRDKGDLDTDLPPENSMLLNMSSQSNDEHASRYNTDLPKPRSVAPKT